MGKIKSKVVRRAADSLLQNGVDFNDNFEYDKKVLSRNMPSKKLRNQLAGFLARLKRQEKESKPKLE